MFGPPMSKKSKAAAEAHLATLELHFGQRRGFQMFCRRRKKVTK
jgi:hypothetical protein